MHPKQPTPGRGLCFREVTFGATCPEGHLRAELKTGRTVSCQLPGPGICVSTGRSQLVRCKHARMDALHAQSSDGRWRAGLPGDVAVELLQLQKSDSRHVRWGRHFERKIYGAPRMSQINVNSILKEYVKKSKSMQKIFMLPVVNDNVSISVY